MAIEDSSLQLEISRVLADGPKPVSAHWNCIFETSEGEVTPIKLLSLDIQRRYNENFADKIILSVVIGLGSFIHHLYPFKDDLSVLMTRRPLREDYEEADIEEIDTRRYRAILLTDMSDKVESKSSATQSADAGDKFDIVELQFQLLEEAVEHIRVMTVGGIYNRIVPGKVIQQVLTEAAMSLDLTEEDGIVGVDMVDPDNTETREHLVIPHGTKIFDLPAYVQDLGGGVYNTGIGCYLQMGTWYIYPEYDTRRFDDIPDTLTVINVPENRYTSLNRTYRLAGKHLIVLATGEVSHLDASNVTQINMGTGTRYTDTERLIDGFGETKGNKTTVRRGDNNSEYQATQRQDRLVNAPVAAERSTSNPYTQATRLARRQGEYIQLVWENSDPDVIYPGMPAKFLYLDGGEVSELEGIIMAADHYIHNTHSGMVVGNHRCNSTLVLFVSNQADL